MVESALDRMALENCYDDTGSGVRTHKYHHPINSYAEPFLWEDTDIK